MHAGLDRVLLGRLPESIPSHRMQHVETGHSLLPADHVRRDVVPAVTYRKPRSGRIWEEVQTVEGFGSGPGAGAIQPGLLPETPPSVFDRSEIVAVQGAILQMPAGSDRIIGLRMRQTSGARVSSSISAGVTILISFPSSSNMQPESSSAMARSSSSAAGGIEPDAASSIA